MHTPAGFTPAHLRPESLAGNTLAFAFRGDKLLVGGTADVPVVPELAATQQFAPGEAVHYLGELDGISCMAVVLADDAPEPEGWRYAGLRSLFFKLPERLIAIAQRAYQVVEWERTHRYCGRCGTPTRDKENERAKECPRCGYTAFPHSLMIAYTAEYAGGELRPDQCEITEARWFPWDAVPNLPPSISISRRLITATIERLAREAS